MKCIYWDVSKKVLYTRPGQISGWTKRGMISKRLPNTFSHPYLEKEEKKEQSLQIQKGLRDFRCMVSTDRFTHPPSFIRQAGCHTCLRFPGRCQLLLHTIEQAKRVGPSQLAELSLRTHNSDPYNAISVLLLNQQNTWYVVTFRPFNWILIPKSAIKALSPLDNLVSTPVIGGAIGPALSGKVFWDVHGQTSRDLNREAGLNIILYSDWL